MRLSVPLAVGAKALCPFTCQMGNKFSPPANVEVGTKSSKSPYPLSHLLPFLLPHRNYRLHPTNEPAPPFLK